MPNNKKQENVDSIRKDFAKRVYDLYINAANGKVDTYDKFLTRLEWLEIDYSDALSPYGIYEDLCPDDFDLVKNGDRGGQTPQGLRLSMVEHI